jgi:hypothetical protein
VSLLPRLVKWRKHIVKHLSQKKYTKFDFSQWPCSNFSIPKIIHLMFTSHRYRNLFQSLEPRSHVFISYGEICESLDCSGLKESEDVFKVTFADQILLESNSAQNQNEQTTNQPASQNKRKRPDRKNPTNKRKRVNGTSPTHQTVSLLVHFAEVGATG